MVLKCRDTMSGKLVAIKRFREEKRMCMFNQLTHYGLLCVCECLFFSFFQNLL